MINLRTFKRSIKYAYQRLRRGWDDSDTWSLDFTIAKFVHPRLVRFKEVNIAYPHSLTPEEWDDILDEMIYSMYILSKDDTLEVDGVKPDWDRVSKGLEYFGRYFRDLWW